MATIRDVYVLEDKFTSVMTQCIQTTQRMTNAMSDLRYSAANVETATAQMAKSMTSAKGAGDSLGGSLRTLLGLLGGFQAVRWLVNTSDQLTGINSRLKMMTGNLEEAERLENEIYASAMRTGSAYADTAAFVAKLGTLAGNAFSSNQEIVAFAEQINKQMALSGTTTQEAQAAMLQLTQGLASGTLRGEELNSVLEQTPMIAQTIAKYMGVNTGEMRELASQGAITADVVKNAMLSAADETNEAFEQMPMTWGRVFNKAKNIITRALDPVLDAISFVADHIEVIGPIVLGAGAAFAIFVTAANWVNICTAATKGLNNALKAVKTVFSSTFGLPLLIITGIITALYGVVGAVNKATNATYSATGIIAGLILAVLSEVANIFISVFNVIVGLVAGIYNVFIALANFLANVFKDPLGSIARLFFDLADVVLGILETLAGAIDAIFGSSLADAVAGWRSSLSGWVDDTFGKGEEVYKKLDPKEYSIEPFDQMEMFKKGYEWGGNLGSSVSDLMDGFTQQEEYTEDIAEDVAGIRKAVDMSQEDLRALVDVAERRYVNNINLTAQTPVITVNGANTGNTPEDRKALADTIRDILVEQVSAGSTRTTARTF